MIIGITGENGFIGSHLLIRAKRRYGYEVNCLGRPFALRLDKLKKLDRIIHCAAVHRDENPENVYYKNMEIHQSLIDLLSSNNLSPSIVMLSSIQEGDGSFYGSAKQDGSLLLENFCKMNRSNFLKFNLNNTFGPYSQPYKYSFVATFCYNILNNIHCNVSDREITLSYIEDVADGILMGRNDGFPTYTTSVLHVFERLEVFKKTYLDKDVIPVFNSRFDYLLYNTLVSFIDYRITSS